MYKIMCISSGIVVQTYGNRTFALAWLEDNNFDEQGNCLNLFRMEKSK